MSLNDQMNKYNSLSPIAKRAVAAVIGAHVADAASMPLHWIYDVSKLEEIVGSSNPEFWPSGSNLFYSLPTGRTSCYNVPAVVMLRCLPGDFNSAVSLEEYKRNLSLRFGPDSDFAEALRSRQKAYDPSQRNVLERKPIPGPWQQGNITKFLENYAAGKDVTGDPTSDETDGFCGSIPLIAWLSLSALSEEQRETIIRTAVEILTAAPFTVGHAIASARLLNTMIVEGEKSPEIISYAFQGDGLINVIKSEFQAVHTISQSSMKHADAVARFGKACGNPGSFQGALLAMITTDSYVDAVRKNILAGGDQCSRANFIGACCGAAYGIGTEKGIPIEWIEKTEEGSEILALCIDKFSAL